MPELTGPEWGGGGLSPQDPGEAGLGKALGRPAPRAPQAPQRTLWELADPWQHKAPAQRDPVRRLSPAARCSAGHLRTRFGSCLWAEAPSFVDADGHGDKPQWEETCFLTT